MLSLFPENYDPASVEAETLTQHGIYLKLLNKDGHPRRPYPIEHRDHEGAPHDLGRDQWVVQHLKELMAIVDEQKEEDEQAAQSSPKTVILGTSDTPLTEPVLGGGDSPLSQLPSPLQGRPTPTDEERAVAFALAL